MTKKSAVYGQNADLDKIPIFRANVPLDKRSSEHLLYLVGRQYSHGVPRNELRKGSAVCTCEHRLQMQNSLSWSRVSLAKTNFVFQSKLDNSASQPPAEKKNTSCTWRKRHERLLDVLKVSEQMRIRCLQVKLQKHQFLCGNKLYRNTPLPPVPQLSHIQIHLSLIFADCASELDTWITHDGVRELVARDYFRLSTFQAQYLKHGNCKGVGPQIDGLYVQKCSTISSTTSPQGT